MRKKEKKMAATFSYAQAAKGLPATQSPASKPEDQNTDISTQANEALATTETDAPAEVEKTIIPSDKEAEPAVAANANHNVSGTSSPSVSNSSTTAPKDEDSNTVNGSSESTWDKQSQASGAEKLTEEANEKKDEKKDVPPKELKAAPLPSVNVWQQRKEAQEAKAKAVAASKPASTKTGASKTASAASSTAGEPQQEVPKAALKKKGADGAGDGAKRNKADGTKGRDEGKF